MTSKHTKKGHLIKFFLGKGPENLISCSAFWPSVCDELSSDVLVCQEFPHIEDTEACLKCVNLLPSILLLSYYQGDSYVEKKSPSDSTSFQKALCIFKQKCPAKVKIMIAALIQ